MTLTGYDITRQVFIGADRREYTRNDLALMGITNPVDYMAPIGRAKIAPDRES